MVSKGRMTAERRTQSTQHVEESQAYANTVKALTWKQGRQLIAEQAGCTVTKS